MIRGYAFGHAVFYAEAVEAAPGHDITVVVKDGEDVSQAADELEKKGLIKNIYAFLFQSRFMIMIRYTREPIRSILP